MSDTQTVTVVGFRSKNRKEETILDFNLEVKEDPLASGWGQLVEAPASWEYWYGRNFLLGLKVEVTPEGKLVNESVNLAILRNLIIIYSEIDTRRGELLSISTSGQHLGAARSWIQRKCINGNSVTWTETNRLEREFTVGDVEEIAHMSAHGAVTDMQSRLLVNFRELLRMSAGGIAENFRLMIEMRNLETRYQAERLRADPKSK